MKFSGFIQTARTIYKFFFFSFRARRAVKSNFVPSKLHRNATAPGPKISHGRKDKCKLFSSIARCSFFFSFSFFFRSFVEKCALSFYGAARLFLFFFSSSTRLNLFGFAFSRCRFCSFRIDMSGENLEI